MFADLLPLLYFSHKAHDGGLLHTGQYWHLWRQTPTGSSTSQLDLVGVLVGLGGVISSYWCTDYGLVQRAPTAHDLESALRVPLIAGFGKLLFAVVVVGPVILMSGHFQYGNLAILMARVPTLPQARRMAAVLDTGMEHATSYSHGRDDEPRIQAG